MGEKPSTVAGNFTDNHMQHVSRGKPLVGTCEKQQEHNFGKNTNTRSYKTEKHT